VFQSSLPPPISRQKRVTFVDGSVILGRVVNGNGEKKLERNGPEEEQFQIRPL
jgi:hypothetical protein